MNGPLFISAKGDVEGTWGGLPCSYLEQEESVGFPLIPSFIQAGELRKCWLLETLTLTGIKAKKKKKKGGSSNVVFFKEPIPVLWNARESWRTWASPSGNEPSFLSGYRKMWYQETSLRQYLANVAEWCGGIGWEWKVCFPLLTDSWLAALTPPSLFLLLLFDEEAGL